MRSLPMLLTGHVWLLVAFAVTLFGCAHPSRTAFSRDFSCPIKEVRTRPLYAGAYEATGCGKSAGYHCPNGPPGLRTCRRSEAVVQRREKKDQSIALRRRFEADTGCRARYARVTRSASGSFIVSGCSREAEYVCRDEVCDPAP